MGQDSCKVPVLQPVLIMSSFKIPVLGVLCMTLSQVSSAQTIPVCASQAADPDGDGFGYANGASCIVTSDSAGPPEFINQETSLPVNIVRAYWDGLVDFNNPVTCTRYAFVTDRYVASTSLSVTLTFSPLTTSAPYVGRVTRVRGAGSESTFDWSMDNGIYTGPTNLGRSPWFEIVNAGDQKAVRTWFSNSIFNQCAAVDPNKSFSPTGIPFGVVPQAQECVDTPPVGDGWGWDGVTSCRVTGDVEPVVATCEDTPPVGDGWGWDGVASCRVAGDVQPVTATCEDTAPIGDGWGWDGVTSCRVSGDTQPVASSCEDTAPIGDGWGWDGTASCRVSGSQVPVSAACVDTAPLGDGWGWDGTTSCRVSGVAPPVTSCVDTTPFGDGWGWDGQNSCRI